jgi:tetratricopeptide (TPR) repeat protein
MAVWTEWDWEKGEQEFLSSIGVNPNDALARIHYAHLLLTLRRPQEAMTQAELALELDPLRPLIMSLYASAMLCRGDYQSAYEQANKAVAIEPENYIANITLEYAAYCTKDYSKSIEIIKQIYPLDTGAISEMEKAFIQQGYEAAMTVRINSILNSVYAEFYPPAEIALYYMRSGDIDRALDWFEKAFEIHDPNMPYISTEIYHFNKLDENQRYIELLKKMNLPLP